MKAPGIDSGRSSNSGSEFSLPPDSPDQKKKGKGAKKNALRLVDDDEGNGMI